MIFSVDSDLIKFRTMILDYLPSSMTSWDDYHREAGLRLISDIEVVWYRKALQARYQDYSSSSFAYLLSTYPFDSTILNAGWHYRSNETTAIAAGERVRVVAGHSGGGTANHIYKSAVNRVSSDLSTMNFTGANWTDVTTSLENLLLDAACYQTLFMIYRSIANDVIEPEALERQRDYFAKEYEKEVKRIADVGIPYDWDESGVVDSDETDSIQVRGKTMKVVW